LHDFANHNNPDEHFEKTQQGRCIFVPFGNHYNPERANGLIHDAGTENKQGQDEVLKKLGVVVLGQKIKHAFFLSKVKKAGAKKK